MRAGRSNPVVPAGGGLVLQNTRIQGPDHPSGALDPKGAGHISEGMGPRTARGAIFIHRQFKGFSWDVQEHHSAKQN